MHKQIRPVSGFRSVYGHRGLLALILLGALCAPVPAFAKKSGDAAPPADQAETSAEPAKKLKKTPKFEPKYETDSPENTSSVDASTSEDGQEEGPKPDTVEFARAQLGKKDFKGAIQTYKTIFLARPYDADVLLGIAYCSEQLGDLDEAIKYARQATQAEPNSPETHVALGHYLDQNHDWKAAYLQYSRAIDLKPDDDLMEQIWAPTLRILMSMNEANNTQVAVRLAHKWVHDYPKEATVQYNNGWILSQAGDEKKYPEAVQSYEAACRLDPGLVGAHYNLALLHLKMANKDAAITELDQFITLAPNDPDVKQAKALFAKLKAQGATPIVALPTVKTNAKSSSKKTFKSVEATKPAESVSPAVKADLPAVPVELNKKDRAAERARVKAAKNDAVLQSAAKQSEAAVQTAVTTPTSPNLTDASNAANKADSVAANTPETQKTAVEPKSTRRNKRHEMPVKVYAPLDSEASSSVADSAQKPSTASADTATKAEKSKSVWDEIHTK